ETTLSGSSVTATANSTSNANANSHAFSLALLASGTLIHVTADAAHSTETGIGHDSAVTLTGAGTFSAISNTTTTVDTDTTTIGTVQIGAYTLSSTTHSHTLAYVGDGADV